jgi:integrase
MQGRNTTPPSSHCNRPEIETPKTDRSVRSIAMSRASKNALRPWRRAQLEDRLAWAAYAEDVRHSYATAALRAGIPAKVVSERLGHKSIAITLDIDSHVLPQADEEAAETVERLLLGEEGATPPALWFRLDAHYNPR